MKRLSFLLLFYASTSCAFFCPSNFSDIQVGDTLEQALLRCGKPLAERNLQSNKGVQEWIYYVKPSPLNNTNTKLSFLIKEGRVINIHVNNSNATNSELCQSIATQAGQQSDIFQVVCKKLGNVESEDVASSALCGRALKVGDLKENVESNCGKPVYITQLEAGAQTTEIVELDYQGPPPTTLVFENGRLKERKYT